jgi:tetratricopeptide (TPR) repeat protein
LGRLGEVLAELGEYEAALAAVQQAATMSPLEQDRLDGSIVERSLVYVLARAGHRDEALERISRGLDGPGGYSRTELRLAPAWDFFRDDARFNTLIGPEGEK